MGNTSGKADANPPSSSSSSARQQYLPNVPASAHPQLPHYSAGHHPAGSNRSHPRPGSSHQRGGFASHSQSSGPVTSHGSSHLSGSAAAAHGRTEVPGQLSTKSPVSVHSSSSSPTPNSSKRASTGVMADKDKQKDVSLPPLSASRQNSTANMSSNPPAGGRSSPPSSSAVRPVPPSPSVHPSMASSRGSPSHSQQQQQGQGSAAAAGGDAGAAPGFITQVSQTNPSAAPQVQQQAGIAPPVDADNSPLLPLQKAPFTGRPLLVLDLDETLVHSSFRPVTVPDIVLPVELHGTQYHVYVKKRPYVHEFLEAVAQRWEVCVFTASVSQYADPLLDKLDPTGTLIQHRLFRQHCAFVNGLYVKDLDRMNRPLERVVILDNSPTAYLFHPNNALPILSWFDNMDDTELRYVLPALEELSRAPNIYPVLEDFVAVLQDHESGQ
eukprot:TRINITY_DN924_c0_g1_i1.p1 TRINITY_DN924_c0_g1~~TRINITY_DN924_c0_g1_i1.p1  ORF type:complete len:439 (-),score=58.84 TRINITY_DN924_c0_g1_i1:968-2284(-)